MCHYFVRIKLASATISCWREPREKYPRIHLAHTLPTRSRVRHACVRVCSPSELLTFSSRLIAIDICLSSWACPRARADLKGWCYLLEEEKEKKGKGGRREKRWKWTVVDKLPTRPPGIYLDPDSPERSQGDSTLHPHYKRAVAVARVCGRQYGPVILHWQPVQPSLSFALTVNTDCESDTCTISSSSWNILIDAWIKMHLKMCCQCELLFVLEDSGWNGGLHLVGCFQHLWEKEDTLLLYRGSLLVADRGRAIKLMLISKVFTIHGEEPVRLMLYNALNKGIGPRFVLCVSWA